MKFHVQTSAVENTASGQMTVELVSVHEKGSRGLSAPIQLPSTWALSPTNTEKFPLSDSPLKGAIYWFFPNKLVDQRWVQRTVHCCSLFSLMSRKLAKERPQYILHTYLYVLILHIFLKCQILWKPKNSDDRWEILLIDSDLISISLLWFPAIRLTSTAH